VQIYSQNLKTPMLHKIFKQKTETVPTDAEPVVPVAESPAPSAPRLSLEEQKRQRFQRKKLVIDEFGKSVINLKLQQGILTPLHIVDVAKVDLQSSHNLHQIVENGVKKSLEHHKENLRHKLYRELFNLQPGHLLVVTKDKKTDQIISFKDYNKNLDKFLELLNPFAHRLLLVRYFIPPIPDDMHQFDDVELPEKFEVALRDIVNYCDLNYSLDNVTFDKWYNLINSLSDTGVILNFPNHTEEKPFEDLLGADYSHMGYRKIRAKLILKDTVEKHTVVIPLFILLLAFFCSDKKDCNSFLYHFLFTATGEAKQRSMERGDVSFFKLFNQLLDESLLPEQFNKCLSIIYNESFRLHQTEIDDLFLSFRERLNPNLSISSGRV
jgi:hypothetical protein